MDKLDLLVLHQHPELIEATADLVNEEWSRSKTSRIHSLSKSCDELPCNLILVSGDDELKQIIGHSRLASVHGNNKAHFLESVVVRKKLRGKGYGRKLMDETEKYAKSNGVDTMYLTTTDKEAFYRHLGYELCKPILSYGSAKIPEHLIQKLMGTNITENTPSVKGTKPSLPSTFHKQTNTTLSTSPPPPPPLPQSKSNLKDGKNKFDPHSVVWMKKELTQEC